MNLSISHPTQALRLDRALSLPGGRFDGSTVAIHEGAVGPYWNYPWMCCSIHVKEYASQTQDFAMIFRAKSSVVGDRLTVAIRTGGYINVRIRKGDGTAGREIQSVAVAAVGDVVGIYPFWDTVALHLVMNIVHNGVSTLYHYSSSSPASLAADADPSGIITLGDNYGRIYPYKGRAFLGSFRYGLFGIDEINSYASNLMAPYGEFVYAPGTYGGYGAETINEPNERHLTLTSTDVPAWW